MGIWVPALVLSMGWIPLWGRASHFPSLTLSLLTLFFFYVGLSQWITNILESSDSVTPSTRIWRTEKIPSTAHYTFPLRSSTALWLQGVYSAGPGCSPADHNQAHRTWDEATVWHRERDTVCHVLHSQARPWRQAFPWPPSPCSCSREHPPTWIDSVGFGSLLLCESLNFCICPTSPTPLFSLCFTKWKF